jgi:very-short-patch-repair endonuclease
LAHSDQKEYEIKRAASPIENGQRARARYLRTHDTDAEYRLWFVLRGKKTGVKFRRQQVIGPYIVDFYCSELKLVIEADGGQHTSEKDATRDAFLRQEGMTVLRFWNNEIMENTYGVSVRIDDVIAGMQRLHPHPNPPPFRGREDSRNAERE